MTTRGNVTMESTPNYDLAFLLLLGSRTVIDHLHKYMAALGYDDVRPAHGFAFQRIAPHGATGNELAEFLDITKQAASEMVDYLEQRGYVVRQPHPSDRKSTRLNSSHSQISYAVFCLKQKHVLGFPRLHVLRNVQAGKMLPHDLFGRVSLDPLGADVPALHPHGDI